MGWCVFAGQPKLYRLFFGLCVSSVLFLCLYVISHSDFTSRMLRRTPKLSKIMLISSRSRQEREAHENTVSAALTLRTAMVKVSANNKTTTTKTTVQKNSSISAALDDKSQNTKQPAFSSETENLDNATKVLQKPTPHTPPVQNRTFWVTTRTSGRMGNHMFMYASLLGVAARNNRTHSPFFPKSLLINAFDLTHYRPHQSSQGFKVIGERMFGAYNKRTEKLPQADVVLAGYLQSWKYFHHIRPTISSEFRFKDSIRRQALTLLETATKGKGKVKATKVGVHVRRSDMLNPAVRQSGFQSPPVSFYLKAAQYFRQKYSDVIFVVVTDGPGWCRENFASDDFVVAERAGPEVHLAVLTLCDHVISSVGTFGWWGGYLCGGDVVYYKNQIIPLTFRAKHIRQPDYFLPDWVAIGD